MVGATFVALGVAQCLTQGVGFLPELPICALGTEEVVRKEVGSIGSIHSTTNVL